MASSYPPYVDDESHPDKYRLKIYDSIAEQEKAVSEFTNENDAKQDLVDDIYQERVIKFKAYNAKRIKWIQDYTNSHPNNIELRKKVRVLIIIGTCVQLKTIGNDDYVKHNEDIVTALLIKHLFHYACAIPNDQILITSSNQNNFKIINDHPEYNVSPSSSPPSTPPKESHMPTLYKNPNDIFFFQTIFAQVGTKQYHFRPDNGKRLAIFPFNQYFLQQFKTDPESELYVFFLDHGTAGFFQDFTYNFFVERLLTIQCKHMYIFNQSCYSGSLIDLITISKTIIELFSTEDASKPTPKEIFLKLYEISQNYSKDDLTKEQKEEQISKELLEIKKHLTRISDDVDNKLKTIIEHLQFYKTSIPLDPIVFAQFGEKATIICSSPFYRKCPALPFRRFFIGNKTTISSHGGVFISLIIQTLFHPDDGDENIEQFIRHIQNEFITMKPATEPFIKEQFTYSEAHYNKIFYPLLCNGYLLTKSQLQNDCQDNLDELENYYKIDYTQNETCYYTINKLPNIKSIIYPEEYWNVDITDVDISEYDGLKSYDFTYYVNPQKKHDSGQYGPCEDVGDLLKFLSDFNKCIDKCLEDKTEIKTEWPSHKENYSANTQILYHKIWNKIRHLIDAYLIHAYNHVESFIKHNLEHNFSTQPDLFVKACVETLETILPLYKGIPFFPY